MEVVHEDPVRSYLPLSGHFCQGIGGGIVLSWDVMQLDASELVIELVHFLAVCCHERAFVGGLFHDLLDDELGVTKDVESGCS